MSSSTGFPVLAAVLGSTLLAMASAVRAQPAEPSKNRCFEMRTYTAADGKLDALHARFRDHTNALFTRHGMTMIGYWTPADPPRSQNTLVYILAYADRAARDKAWKEFEADPEWKAAKAESEKDGKLVVHVESVFLNPTDYSPIK